MIRLSSVLTIGLSVLVLHTGCRSTRDLRETTLSKNVDYLVEQGRISWEKRSNSEYATRAFFFLSKAYELKSGDNELAILYSRSCYFQAYNIESDPGKIDSLYQLGAQVAKSVLFQAPVVQEAFADLESDSTILEQTAIGTADHSLTPALYWWAANLGRYLISKPVMERLKYRELLETIMLRVMALNPNYYYGGPYRFFGTLYVRLPGVELSRSKSYFDQAIMAYPDYFATKVLMAQYYHTKAGNRDQFRSDLEDVINSDPTLIPDVMPENLFEQEHARKLLQQESLLFE